jgi:hypothetical protein
VEKGKSLVVSVEGVMEGEEVLRVEGVMVEGTLTRNLDLSLAVITVVAAAMERALGVEMCAPLYCFCWQNSHRMDIT